MTFIPEVALPSPEDDIDYSKKRHCLSRKIILFIPKSGTAYPGR
jgi:hypothetical protein